MPETFRALVLDQADGKTVSRIEDLSVSALPEGEVLVEVAYSTLNYKDGLAITGAGKIVRQFPFVPGIDFAGRVRESSDDRHRPGDEGGPTGWGARRAAGGGSAAGSARACRGWPPPAGCASPPTAGTGPATRWCSPAGASASGTG